MPSPQKLSTTHLNSFQVLQWKGQPLYEYYPRLRSYLESRYGTEASYFFARPKVEQRGKGDTVLVWYSDILETEPSQGPRAHPPRGAEHIVEMLQQAIAELSKSGKEERAWAQLLKLCLANYQSTLIYSDGTYDVFAGWGLLPLGTQLDPAYIKDIPSPAEENRTSPSPSEEPFSEAPQMEAADKADAVASASKPPHQEVDSANKTTDQASQEEAERHSKGQGTQNPFRKYLWPLLGIAALLFVLVFWIISKGPSRPDIPEEPGKLIPIDTTEIGYDQDSTRAIVQNRLNVFLEDSTADLAAFMQAFKKTYPDDTYKVLYFDTLTSIVQLQVPPEALNQVEKELPGKMPGFKLSTFPEVIFERHRTPNDPGFSRPQYSWYFDLINAAGGWNRSFGSDQVVVAIIDDGFDLNHPEFAGKVVKPYNAYSQNRRVYSSSRHAHGTHVAGTAIAARDNRAGLSGIAPDCLLMPIQVADRDGTLAYSAIIKGIYYAIQNGAQVINLSLGMQFNPNLKYYPPETQEEFIRRYYKQEEAYWRKIFQIAERNGVSIVLAGGNQSVLIGLDPMQRSPLGIKVSAVNRQQRRAEFSNYGDYSTLSAPGVNILSSLPGNNFGLMSGTSMAAPMVTGAVALAKSVAPSLSPAEIRQKLVSTGRRISSNIGPLLQLDALVQSVGGATSPPSNGNNNCNNIAQQIDALQRKIDDLKKGCSTYQAVDTMKMPKGTRNFNFALGRWRSTTPLTNSNNEQVTVYFTFLRDGTGEINLVEPNGLRCAADLDLALDQQNQLIIDQLSAADCQYGQPGYAAYTFYCQPDAGGTVTCRGRNKNNASNQPKFNLIKIN
jgi:subtilisin family serine protease